MEPIENLYGMETPYTILIGNLREHLADFASFISRSVSPATSKQYVNLLRSMLEYGDIRDKNTFDELLTQYQPSTHSMRISARRSYLKWLGHEEVIIGMDVIAKRTQSLAKARAIRQKNILVQAIYQWLVYTSKFHNLPSILVLVETARQQFAKNNSLPYEPLVEGHSITDSGWDDVDTAIENTVSEVEPSRHEIEPPEDELDVDALLEKLNLYRDKVE